MEFKQIQELIKAINKSNISELSIKDGEFEITIRQDQGMDMSGFMPVQQAYMPQQMQMPQAPLQMPESSVQIQAPATAAPAAPQVAPASEQPQGTPIKSPMIGTFYRCPSPDKPPFVNVGDEIKKGQVLCVIEAMKLFNEIESEVSGRIVKVCVDDATPVEYDQPLFIVEPL